MAIATFAVMLRRSLRILLLLLLLLGGWEVMLRMRGYHQLPVFVADKRYEYMTAPDQTLSADGVRFITNELGMRCGSVGAKKGKRVLVVGDSVINGGLSSTQDSLATSIAERATGVQVLNSSAPSWGPDNAAAFLDVHGHFDSDLLVAVFSSHDAFDRMTFEPIVGHHPAYPDHAPLLALEAYMRDLLYSPSAPTPAPSGAVFNEGWKALTERAHATGIPFVVLLHPEAVEVAQHGYDARGQQLLDSLHAWNVPVVELLGSADAAMYWDRIHLNDHGQRALGRALEETIRADGGD